jgi:hypothetical protein
LHRVTRQRFELALERLRPAQWERFEQLASEFLVDEYDQLRTVASHSGDRGRDAEVFQPDGDPAVLCQFSLRKDWEAKIAETAGAITAHHPDARVLVYVTNQVIGAQADALRSRVRKDNRLTLDVRDRSWFLERMNTTRGREIAAEALAEEIADPYLRGRDLIDDKAKALTTTESRAACVYLALQWTDDQRDKGLTKLCFEALVRAALRDTDSDNRMRRAEVRERVHELLPAHPVDRVHLYVDNALNRLTKRYIRHWKAQDEFCLTHEERQRIADRLAEIDHAEHAVVAAIIECVIAACESLDTNAPCDVEVLADGARKVIDAILLRRGETFAAAVHRGDVEMAAEKLPEIVEASMEAAGLAPHEVGKKDITQVAVERILLAPSEAVQQYLRNFADAYTLFAFMRETPDVQSAVVKLFANGEIWLDASVILPLFAEELVEDGAQRVYTNMVTAATESGLRLFTTEGVLEEVDGHMRRGLAFARLKGGEGWRGQVPFIFSVFALTGRAPRAFASWLETFRGAARPEDDIADYLRETFGVTVQNLRDDTDRAPSRFRTAVQEIWHEVHQTRRGTDPTVVTRLVDHDVENYVGVTQRRRRERDNALGYTSWWLTLDRNAFRIRRQLFERLDNADVPDSPAMSPDFMVSYLAIGPIRNRIAKRTEAHLPLAVTDLTQLELLPTDLMDTASSVRDSLEGLPERVIQRKVRDALDAQRRRAGLMVARGMRGVEEDLSDAIAVTPDAR